MKLLKGDPVRPTAPVSYRRFAPTDVLLKKGGLIQAPSPGPDFESYSIAAYSLQGAVQTTSSPIY